MGGGTGARRAVRAAAATLALAGGAVVAAPPAGACACGGLVDGPAYDTSVSQEAAVLQWDGTTETMLIELDALSNAPEVGLILPTPAPAEVALADPQVFRELDDLTQPRAVATDHRWWPELGFGTAGSDGAGAPAGVAVLDEVRLGPLDVTTLGATDPAALGAWLTERGFQLPEEIQTALAPYVAEGWSFVAARLAPEEATAFDGTLQPLRVTFPSGSLVYPMRMSAVADETQSTRTYVLADHRVDRVDATAEAQEPTVRFAGRVDPGSVSSDELAALLASGSFVTSHEQVFTEPGTQIVSDFTFSPAAADVAYTPTVAVVADKRIGPFFAGPVLAFAGVLALAVLVIWSGRRRRAPAPALAPRPARA
ncbi:DUF2330 domain-containing protein [Cellulosimicrobium protaetiae]|uniref:DUF2330 domain-containing protein n=1 Tax=Cellulosimicrobium protaetiae TaxID=2587808 RepID=A0A6M5UCU8_9MICO|nr:DUF2330 domain-containing protein [Cellulosimicrobium protaetiae]QJW34908.1 DUF2330 domain-containing protein [Cellulosimicrobium protaetiae]